MSKLEVKLERVTPKRAREFLTNNYEHNRRLRTAKVQAYARDMREGRWDALTGETVKMTDLLPDGVMLDGQHRMAAIDQAGVAVQLLVAYGVPQTAMTVIDTGLARSFADRLKVEGITSRHLVGAVVRRVIQWERGNYTGQTGGRHMDDRFSNPTHAEKLARFEKEPEAFVAAAHRAEDVRNQKLGQGSPAGTAFFILSAIDHQMAHNFFDALIEGANLPKKSPILSLRNRMTRMRAERAAFKDELALYMRAWNAYREDRELERVMVSSAGRGLTNDNFPIPK